MTVDQRAVDAGFPDGLEAGAVNLRVIHIRAFTEKGVSSVFSGLEERLEEQGFTQITAVFWIVKDTAV